MTKFKTWISAARLRTLPLSVAGILVGSACALAQFPYQAQYGWILGLAVITTLLLQILSNFANDYGDGVKGTDNEARIGPQRAVQSGIISAIEMKRAVIFTALLALIAAVILIYISFGKEFFWTSIFFLLLGIASIAAAIKYTVGSSAYGYRGLGDVFVFVFFGLVSVLGSYYLYGKTFGWLEILPAIAIGNLSISVLNINNMRDLETDKLANKMTIVVKMGAERAKKYHYTIILTALLAILLYALIAGLVWYKYYFVIAFIPLIKHLRVVYTNRDPRELDSQMKVVALSTFLLSILFSLALIF